MEIDEIKSSWHTATGDKERHLSVSEIIHLRSNSPLSAIRKRLRKQIIVIGLSFVLTLKTFMHKDLVHDVFFWCYAIAVIVIMVFFVVHYRLTGRIKNGNNQTAFHLRQYVLVLEKNLQAYRSGITVVLVFFIILSETLPYFTYESMLVKWHMIPWMVRTAVYMSLLVFKYFVSRFLYQRRYGKYLAHLHEVLGELQ